MPLDPRCRLILLMLGGASLFGLDSLLAQLLFFWLLIFGSYLLGLGLQRLWHPVRFLRFIIPLTFTLQIVFSAIGNWQSGVAMDWRILIGSALFYTLRITNLVLVMAVAYNWLSLIELVDAIYYLLKPLRRWRMPVDNLFQMIFIALRFFPEVKLSFQQMYACLQSFSPPVQRLRDRLHLISEVMVPVMIVSFRRAEILAEAMTMRGYLADGERTHYGRLQWRRRDGLVLLIGALISVLGVSLA